MPVRCFNRARSSSARDSCPANKTGGIVKPPRAIPRRAQSGALSNALDQRIYPYPALALLLLTARMSVVAACSTPHYPVTTHIIEEQHTRRPHVRRPVLHQPHGLYNPTGAVAGHTSLSFITTASPAVTTITLYDTNPYASPPQHHAKHHCPVLFTPTRRCSAAGCRRCPARSPAGG